MSEIPQYPEDIPEPGPLGEPADGDTGNAEFDFSGGPESFEDGEETLDLSLYLRGLGETDNPMIAPDDGWADNAEPGDFVLEDAENSPTALDLSEADRVMLYDAIAVLTAGASVTNDGTMSYHEWRMPSALAEEYGVNYEVRLVCDPVDYSVTDYPRMYGIEARKSLGVEELIDEDGSLVTYAAEQQSSIIFTRDVDAPKGVDAGVSVEEESSIFVDCKRASVGDDGEEPNHVALTKRIETLPLALDEIGRIKEAVTEALRRKAEMASETLDEVPITVSPELLAQLKTAMDLPGQERDETLAALELFAQGGEEYGADYGVFSDDNGAGLVAEEVYERKVPADLLAEERIGYDEVVVRVHLAASPDAPYFVELTAHRAVICNVLFPAGEDGVTECRAVEGRELKIVNFTPGLGDDHRSLSVDIDAYSELEVHYPESLSEGLSDEQMEAGFVVGGDDVPSMTLEELRAINSAVAKASAVPPDAL